MLLLAALSLLVAACDDGPLVEDPCVLDPASCQPPGPEIIGGVNVSALLRAPSNGNIDRAREIWTEGAPVGYTGRVAAEVDEGNSRLYLLEARDAQADTVVALALARRPTGFGVPQTLPVLLIAPATSEVSEAQFLSGAVDEPLTSGWVQVIAVPRGGSVVFEGTARQAPGPPSPYLYEVNDAIGVLASARSAIPGARGRSAAVGFGRGGAIALFASIREPTIQAVATLAAPADLYIGEVPDGIRAALASDATPDVIPGFSTVAADVILPLKAGAITMEEARAQLFARSPAYFLETIAPTVAFHGREDGVVSVVHGRRLETALRGVPALAGSYVETDDFHTSLFDSFGVRSEVSTHLDQASR
ncbi:MAG: hypothetical protein AAGI52_04700 [Bacteroidota bacterium]